MDRRSSLCSVASLEFDRRSSMCSVTSLEIDFSEEYNWNLLPDSLRMESFHALNSSVVKDASEGKETEESSTSSFTSSTNPPHDVAPVAPTGKSLTVPGHNSAYGEMSYWDDRFAVEEEYEWLLSYSHVASQLATHVQATDRILVVGCGNSKFSYDLYQAGYTNICNIDYSETVIAAMKRKCQETCPDMEWKVMDMTNMSEFADESFDVVLDKAAMDALMVQEGDVWNPQQIVIDQARSMCRHISRILKPQGKFLQISFAQPHFRKKYLLGLHSSGDDDNDSSQQQTNSNKNSSRSLGQTREESSEEFQWTFQVETIAEKGCFENFLYIMARLS